MTPGSLLDKILTSFLTVTGLVCIVHGLALAYEPAAWVFAGVAALFVAAGGMPERPKKADK